MARKQAVTRAPGKPKMVRMNVPDHEKVLQAKKKVKTDWDMVRYFGEDVDWNEVQGAAAGEAENEESQTGGDPKQLVPRSDDLDL